MLKVNNYSNLNLILLLGASLIILLLIKSYLLKKINKKDLEIAKEISIGYEEIQEDYGEVLTLHDGTLAVLADGIGKNEAGRISSITSVKTIIKMFKEEGSKDRFTYFIKKAFNKANREIIKRVEKDKGGASVLSVIVTNNLLNYALVGDVMLAVFRNKELVKLSEGHSISEVAKREYYNGKLEKAKALYAIKEKKLLYYIGQESFRDLEISEVPVELYKGDIVVLMTKGIYEGLKWVEFEEILGNKKAHVNEMSEEIMIRIADNKKNNCNGSIILMKYCGKNRKAAGSNKNNY